jgi:hypothetical protein
MKISDELKTSALSMEKQMEEDRQSMDKTWYRDIQEYILPWHGRNLASDSRREDVDGRLRSHSILDSTATQALSVTAAGMQAGINSPSRPWFKIGYADRELSEFKPVREWLDIVERVLRDIYAKSNVYRVVHNIYLELPTFATAAAIVRPNLKTIIRAHHLTCGEYWLGMDRDRSVNRIMRRFSLTAEQLVSQFGEDNVSTAVSSAYRGNRSQHRFDVYHLTEPNDERVSFPFGEGMPYRGIYHEAGFPENKALDVRGLPLFPALAPRWNTVGNAPYGFGPGMTVLPYVKGLQKETMKRLVALDKVVDPPLVGPASTATGIVNTMPGGITIDESIDQRMGLRPLYEVRPDLGAIMANIQDTRQAIRAGLFTDLFTMIANSVDVAKTATEVAALKEEKMMVLGPVLDSVHNELHNPLIDITFHYAMEAGLIPEPPEEVQGLPMEVEYISILAQAQKIVATSGIEQLAGFVGNLASVFPEARHKFNAVEAVDEYANALGTASSILRSDEEVDGIMQAEAEAMAQQQQLEQSAIQSKVLADADAAGPNAMAALTGGMMV